MRAVCWPGRRRARSSSSSSSRQIWTSRIKIGSEPGPLRTTRMTWGRSSTRTPPWCLEVSDIVRLPDIWRAQMHHSWSSFTSCCCGSEIQNGTVFYNSVGTSSKRIHYWILLGPKLFDLLSELFVTTVNSKILLWVYQCYLGRNRSEWALECFHYKIRVIYKVVYTHTHTPRCEFWWPFLNWNIINYWINCHANVMTSQPVCCRHKADAQRRLLGRRNLWCPRCSTCCHGDFPPRHVCRPNWH